MRTWNNTLYLDAMPGRLAPLDTWLSRMRERGITTMVCLTPAEEIAGKSPAYADWLSGQSDVDVTRIPIPDYGVPEGQDVARFWTAAKKVAALTQTGTKVFIHCGAGHGRTGMFAIAVLMQLGLTYEDAYAQILSAGSEPEEPPQKAFLREGPRRAGDPDWEAWDHQIVSDSNTGRLGFLLREAHDTAASGTTDDL